MNLNRVMAVSRARLREFYRDRVGLGWNMLMPFFIIVTFAWVFDDVGDDVFKIGVLQSGQIRDAATQRFKALPHVEFLVLEELEAAITKVERHQLDLLLDARGEPRYWINEHSAKGQLAEQLLLGSYAKPAQPPERQAVSGRALRYVDWVIPGVLAMNMMFSCFWGVGWVVVRYRKNGVLRRLQATPLTPLEFLTAQVLVRLLVTISSTAIVFFGAMLLIDFVMRGSYLVLFLVFLVGAASLTSMGLIVATRLKTEEVADGILNLLSWPMMILSGVWFSLDGASQSAQTIAQLMPLTHLVEASRAVMIDGAGLTEVAPQLGILLLLTLVLLGLGARLFRWS